MNLATIVKKSKEAKEEKEVKESVGRGTTSIDIFSVEVNRKLEKIAEELGTSKRRLSNDILEMYLAKKEFLEKAIPTIQKVKFENGILILRDSDKRAYTDIGMKDGYVYCTLCSSDSCEHAQYGLASAETGILEPLDLKKEKD